MLKSHIVLRLQANTGTEYVGQGSSLLSESIDDWSSWGSQWSLEHVAENTENAVEVLELFGSDTVVGVSLPLDTSHHLRNQDQVYDQWRSKERILADIENSILSAKVLK